MLLFVGCFLPGEGPVFDEVPFQSSGYFAHQGCVPLLLLFNFLGLLSRMWFIPPKPSVVEASWSRILHCSSDFESRLLKNDIFKLNKINFKMILIYKQDKGLKRDKDWGAFLVNFNEVLAFLL